MPWFYVFFTQNFDNSRQLLLFDMWLGITGLFAHCNKLNVMLCVFCRMDCSIHNKCCAKHWGTCKDDVNCCHPGHLCQRVTGFIYKKCRRRSHYLPMAGRSASYTSSLLFRLIVIVIMKLVDKIYRWVYHGIATWANYCWRRHRRCSNVESIVGDVQWYTNSGF